MYPENPEGTQVIVGNEHGIYHPIIASVLGSSVVDSESPAGLTYVLRNRSKSDQVSETR